MQLFTTPKQLERFLNKKIKQAIDMLTERIVIEIQRNIDEYTYNSDEPNKWYERTGDFENSWVQEQAKIEADKIVGGVFHDWKLMRKPVDMGFYEQQTYQHGNAQLGEDRRAELVSLLNVDGLNKGFDFKPKKRRPFFDITIKELTQNFRNNVKQIFMSVGITLK